MSNKQIEDLVDLMFDTDMEEVMKEKSTLEYIHKLQQENKQLKERIDKAIQYIKEEDLYCWDSRNCKEYKTDKFAKEDLLEILGDKE